MHRAAPWLGLGTVQGAAPEPGSLPPLSAEDRDLLTPWVVVIVFTVFLLGFARGADELFQDMGLEAYYADEDHYMSRASMAPRISREHLELRRPTSPVGRLDVDGPSTPRKRKESSRLQRRSTSIHRRRRDTLSMQTVQSIANRHKPKAKSGPPDNPDTPT